MPGREREAITHLDMALRINPTDANAHYDMAIALLRTSGDRFEALSHLQAAVHFDPTRQDARNLAAYLGQVR
jgi:Flp pilus assembly protein TadD